MRFLKHKGDDSTIRILSNNNKTVRYGLVGTVSDLLAAHILVSCDQPPETWCFLAQPGIGLQDKFAGSRAEAVSDIEQ